MSMAGSQWIGGWRFDRLATVEKGKCLLDSVMRAGANGAESIRGLEGKCIWGEDYR